MKMDDLYGKIAEELMDEDGIIDEESLHQWFKGGGWRQAGGKYDGKPCARQPGQKTTPKCVSRKKYSSMSKKERDSAGRRKRKKDPGQTKKSGAAKPTYVKTDPQKGGRKKKKKNEDLYMDLEQIIQEELEAVLDEKKKKKGGKKDACYHKVKSRYKVWPSAYASGALVKCRKVGAKNWGNSKKESIVIEFENQLVENELYERVETFLDEALHYGLIEENDELNEKKRKKKGCTPAKGKKYARRVKGRCVSYGAKGYSIAPGTSKGNSYCARSYGDMKSHGKDCSGKDRSTPLCLSRKKWKCSGKYSRKGK